MKILFIIILIPVMQLIAQDSNKSQPKTVEFVSLGKYAGVWYEIAKIPNSFQRSCKKNTTATYSIQKDGKIKVVNRCVEDDGEINQAEGVARIADKLTNAKLEVSFVSFFGWRPFWGDYWIIGLEDNYQWVIVGHPKREYGWILSRTKSISEETKLKIFSLLKKQGYNPNDFEPTVQE